MRAQQQTATLVRARLVDGRGDDRAAIGGHERKLKATLAARAGAHVTARHRVVARNLTWGQGTTHTFTGMHGGSTTVASLSTDLAQRVRLRRDGVQTAGHDYVVATHGHMLRYLRQMHSKRTFPATNNQHQHARCANLRQRITLLTPAQPQARAYTHVITLPKKKQTPVCTCARVLAPGCCTPRPGRRARQRGTPSCSRGRSRWVCHTATCTRWSQSLGGTALAVCGRTAAGGVLALGTAHRAASTSVCTRGHTEPALAHMAGGAHNKPWWGTIEIHQPLQHIKGAQHVASQR